MKCLCAQTVYYPASKSSHMKNKIIRGWDFEWNKDSSTFERNDESVFECSEKCYTAPLREDLDITNE